MHNVKFSAERVRDLNRLRGTTPIMLKSGGALNIESIAVFKPGGSIGNAGLTQVTWDPDANGASDNSWIINYDAYGAVKDAFRVENNPVVYNTPNISSLTDNFTNGLRNNHVLPTLRQSKDLTSEEYGLFLRKMDEAIKPNAS
jgi:hypothetical protein